ncbi:hypothetical protein ACQKFO_21360 [Rossellomorea sp. NPDC071047]|uniref:hypothetical protein n=1 Tax=Rossellomorea sp. NPDC071047 TaxID=3390675 RepID=UPI003CFE8465
MSKKWIKIILVFTLIMTGVAAFKSDVKAASPHAVESSVSNAWNSGNVKLGSKSNSWTGGTRLVYDVYSSKYQSNGWEIQSRNFTGTTKKYLKFSGWAVLAGYKRHTSSNQSTHIVLKKTSGSSGVGTTKIYNTIPISIDATEDLEYNNQGSGVWNECSASATNKNNTTCNMRYEDVGFTAYIPLDEIFASQKEDAEWKLYIVKRVDNQIVYSSLIVPFEFSALSYNTGKVDLSSGTNTRLLRMNDYPVIRRDYPRQSASSAPNVYFTNGNYYTSIDMEESKTAVWYGVNYGGAKKWANTVYWTFGGSQAVLSYTPPPLNIYGEGTEVYNDAGTEQYTFEYGEPITVRGYISSNQSIGMVNHTQSLNGKYQGNVRSIDYPGATTRWITKTYTNLAPGTYTVRAIADYDDQIPESNESDNGTKTATFIVKERNLQGGETKVLDTSDNEKSSFIYGETVRVRGYIRSNAPIETVNHTHSLNGIWQGNVTAIDYPIAQTRWIQKDYTNLLPGTYNVRAYADFDERIPESNEADNYSATATFKVMDVNLTADKLEILDLNDKPVSHITIGDSYHAKLTYSNTGQAVVGEHVNNLYEDNTFKVGTIKGTMNPGITRNEILEFTAKRAGTIFYSAHVNETKQVFESNFEDNTVSTSIYVNTRPEITLSYDPSTIYEGDRVKVCAVATDADGDLLDVTINMNKKSTGFIEVLNKTDLSSGQDSCYYIDNTEVGKYEFEAEVFDGYDKSDVTISFYSNPLTLIGQVLHTPTWLKLHQAQGNLIEEFYSGEKFVLVANTTNYPISNLSVTMNAVQKKGTIYKPKIPIPYTSGTRHQTEYEDPILMETGTALENGPAEFHFEVEYTNGTVKTDDVTIQIIGDVFEYFKMHRIY